MTDMNNIFAFVVGLLIPSRTAELILKIVKAASPKTSTFRGMLAPIYSFPNNNFIIKSEKAKTINTTGAIAIAMYL